MQPDLSHASSRPNDRSHCCALKGRSDVAHPAFWIAATALIGAAATRVSVAEPHAVLAATVVFIGGGLPHGAYDIALLRRAVPLGRTGLVLATFGYIAVTLVMAIAWLTAPLVALILFLAVAAVHFGEDWQMLDEPFLRVAAGAAVIAAATIGHPADVSVLFVAMSDQRGIVIAQIITAAAPVALLITVVGVVVAWREGNREWATAMTACLILLLVLPPVVGFALFFVFLHSPRHFAEARTALSDMTWARWLATGAILSSAAIIGWWGLERLVPGAIGATLSARAFQLLASVAVPHLLLSRWLETRIDQPLHGASLVSPTVGQS